MADEEVDPNIELRAALIEAATDKKLKEAMTLVRGCFLSQNIIQCALNVASRET